MQSRMTLIALILPAATLLSACNQNETPKTIQSIATTSENVTETTVMSTPDDDMMMSAETQQVTQDLAGLSAVV